MNTQGTLSKPKDPTVRPEIITTVVQPTTVSPTTTAVAMPSQEPSPAPVQEQPTGSTTIVLNDQPKKNCLKCKLNDIANISFNFALVIAVLAVAYSLTQINKCK